MCIEEKQIGTNYEIMVLLETLNNKTTNRISVNFKFFNTLTKSEIYLVYIYLLCLSVIVLCHRYS